MWQRVWPMYYSLTSFDPTLIHSGPDHRCVDALVEKCDVLTGHGLIDLDYGATVQQQYLDVTHSHWESCRHLRRVLDLAFGL